MNEVLKSTPQSLGPPPLVVPGQEDLLGRRISAALIDVGLLLGVFVVLGLTIGQTGVAGGGVSVTLGGVWAGVYLALVLLYYFVLEAAIGQTVGKRLLGLRVVRPDGSRPSIAAIAVRTLLRVVDWLPLLYLVGLSRCWPPACVANASVTLPPRPRWGGRWPCGIAAWLWRRWPWSSSLWACPPTTALSRAE